MSETLFPLVKRNVGEVTYEHVLVQTLPKDIIIGAAERNLYIDQNHEVNLCAYWNVRKPGTYEFSPEYNFYVTDGRECLDIYWNLGIVKDESIIIQKYSSLEDAKGSEYYKDFCWMKKEIEKTVANEVKSRKKDDEFKWNTMWVGTREDRVGGEYEWICSKNMEYVQLKVDLPKKQWILTSSKYRVGDLKKLIDDFEEIDKKELHLLTYHEDLDVENLDKSSVYYPIVELAKEELGLIGGVVPGKKDYHDFKYLEYWTYSYDRPRPPTKILSKEKTRILIDGTIVISEMDGSGRIISRKTKHLDSGLVETCYKNLADFLSLGRLREHMMFGGRPGRLKIKYKDGHIEKYDRGVAYKNHYLHEILKCILYAK